MTTKSVDSIRILYDDESYDDIQLTRSGDFPLYSLCKNIIGIGTENLSYEMYSSGAVAALLFMTAITGNEINYSSRDRRALALLKAWEECSDH